jgi:hypothetical protein
MPPTVPLDVKQYFIPPDRPLPEENPPWFSRYWHKWNHPSKVNLKLHGLPPPPDSPAAILRKNNERKRKILAFFEQKDLSSDNATLV